MTFRNFKKYDLFIILFYIACYTIVFSFYSILKHNAFYSHASDFGIFSQIFWSMIHNGTQTNTLEIGQITLSLMHSGKESFLVALLTPRPAFPINHLGVHFSLILYLFAPLYALFQDPKTLLVLQSLMLGLGALPLYLIAKEKTKSIIFAQAIAIVYLLYPAMYNMNLYDFHELSFAPTIIFFALYFLETDKYRFFWIFFALALFIKEEVALSGLFLGLYIIFAKKERKFGVLVSIISLIYFIATTNIFMPFFGQPYNFIDRYLELTSSKYNSYAGIIYNVIIHPLFALQLIFLNTKKLLYLIGLLLPVIFLPLFSGIAFILVIPSLLINLLSSYPPQYSLYCQYNGVIIPFLFFATIVGYNNFPKIIKKYRNLIPYILIILTITITLSATLRLILDRDFLLLMNTPENIALNNILKKIPSNASVASMENIVPHLTQRKEVWLFPVINNAEYVLFNISETANYWPIGRLGTHDLLKNLLLKKEYGVLDFTGTYVLLKRGFDTSKNDATLLEINKIMTSNN